MVVKNTAFKRNGDQMVENTNYILSHYLFFTIMFSTYFFGLYGYLNTGIYRDTLASFGMLAISLIYLAVCLFLNHGILVLNSSSSMWLSWTFIMIAIELGVTKKVAPNQSFLLTTTEAYPYLLIIIVYFVLYFLVQTEENLIRLLDICETASAVIALFSLIQFFLYPRIILFTLDNVTIRNGMPRIFLGGSTLPIFGTLISLERLAAKSKKHHYLSPLNMILELIKFGIVEQQRGIFTILLICIVLIVARNIQSGPIKAILWMFVLSATIYSIFDQDIGNRLSSLFGFQNDFSLSARTSSIQFFLKKAREYPFLGMGFITSSKNQDPISYALLNNTNGYHCQRSDVGILGLLNMWGIIGVLWYIAYLRKLYVNYKNSTNQWKTLNYLLFIYTFFSSWTLIITDVQRLVLVPLFLVISEKCSEF